MKSAYRMERISGSGRRKIALRAAAFAQDLRRGDFGARQLLARLDKKRRAS